MKRISKIKQFAYVLDCIKSDERELANSERIAYFFERFNDEFNCRGAEIEYPNEQDRIAQYLRGLPFDFAYMNADILKIGESWGFDLSTERAADNFCGTWFDRLAALILQLRKRM